MGRCKNIGFRAWFWWGLRDFGNFRIGQPGADLLAKSCGGVHKAQAAHLPALVHPGDLGITLNLPSTAYGKGEMRLVVPHRRDGEDAAPLFGNIQQNAAIAGTQFHIKELVCSGPFQAALFRLRGNCSFVQKR